MPFQLSPGVNVSEIDLTTGVPAVSSSTGAIAGPFLWGPAEEVKLIDSEVSLVNTFWKPNNDNAPSWFAAANFLSYGRSLYVNRIVSSAATNATSSGTGLLIKNDDHYESNFINGQGSVGTWAAKYPGNMGNSLTVSIADQDMFPTWAYKDEFDGPPSHSDTLIAMDTNSPEDGGSNINDEMHIVVVDTKGMFTGVKGTVLERWAYVSKASNAKSEDGSSIYYAEVINKQSNFIRWMDHPLVGDVETNWGAEFVDGVSYTKLLEAETTLLAGGQGGNGDITSGDFINAYDKYANPDEIDVSLIISGGVSAALTMVDWKTVQKHIVSISNNRKDSVSFISPLESDVINNATNEHVDIINNVRNNINSTSYAVADSNWKQQYDKYNDVYRWIPCNGDVAGLCAQTDSNRDPWWSPAGFNRGHIKNSIRLAWNPGKSQRDELYKNSINPIVTFPGEGTILYGDKTMLAKPSAFDRINVRRLFIVLEKAIAISAKYSLFEFNDAFTRSQFVNMVEPFLRDVKGRRGIYDFKVVCDESNNTGEVIESNEFVGDIYIKPAKSINFIQLNFVAVRTGVDFSEVVGKL